jgi:hypothetical protein
MRIDTDVEVMPFLQERANYQPKRHIYSSLTGIYIELSFKERIGIAIGY